MFTFDIDGNLIPEHFQQGGFVLPQVSQVQQTLNPMSANGLLQSFASTTGTDWNRYVQSQELASRAGGEAREFIAAQQRSEQQKHLIKQYEYQNKKLELDMLKESQAAAKELLALDDNMFLEGDNQLIQKQMEQDGMDDNSMNKNLNLHDPASVYSLLNKRNAYISQYKNAIKRKTTYINSLKELEGLDEQAKRIDFAAAKGYLNVEDATAFMDAQANIRSKVERMKLDPTYTYEPSQDPEYLNFIATTRSFVDQAKFKEMQVLNENERKSVIAMKQAQAASDIAKADQLIQQTQQDAKFFPSRLKAQELKDEFSARLTGAQKQVMDNFLKENPTPTPEEFGEMWRQMNGEPLPKDNNLPNTTDAALAQALVASGASVEEIISAKQRANDKTTTVKYTSDGKGIIGADGIQDYGGYVLAKDGITPIAVMIKGELVNANTKGKDVGGIPGLIDSSIKVIEGKAYLKIKGEEEINRNWVFDKYGLEYGWTYVDDDLKSFVGIKGRPEGTYYSDGYLYIPQDDVKPVIPQNTNPILPGGTNFDQQFRSGALTPTEASVYDIK